MTYNNRTRTLSVRLPYEVHAILAWKARLDGVGLSTAVRRHLEQNAERLTEVYQLVLPSDGDGPPRPTVPATSGTTPILTETIDAAVPLEPPTPAGPEDPGVASTVHAAEEMLLALAEEYVAVSQSGALAGLAEFLGVSAGVAAMLMDKLEQRGVVGPDVDGRPRAVLIDPPAPPSKDPHPGEDTTTHGL